jgi:hypothetical protein
MLRLQREFRSPYTAYIWAKEGRRPCLAATSVARRNMGEIGSRCLLPLAKRQRGLKHPLMEMVEKDIAAR